MTPELWSNISYVLLATGIIFFMVTVILAVKFQLLTMLKAELSRSRKKNKMSAGEEYFAYVENTRRDTNTIEEISASVDIKEVSNAPKPPEKVPHSAPSSADDDPSATVVITAHTPSEPDEGGTVITAGRMQDDGFRITDSIMIVHGDPHAITI